MLAVLENNRVRGLCLGSRFLIVLCSFYRAAALNEVAHTQKHTNTHKTHDKEVESPTPSSGECVCATGPCIRQINVHSFLSQYGVSGVVFLHKIPHIA